MIKIKQSLKGRKRNGEKKGEVRGGEKRGEQMVPTSDAPLEIWRTVINNYYYYPLSVEVEGI